jgi:uncharacterized integral membrane protein (TIGR00697 family)
MIHSILKDRPTKLLLGFIAFFCCNALIADAIGTKLFSLEKLFGTHPANWTLFGQSGLGFTLTCGVLLWPLEFVITDIVNEFYGPRVVRRISYTAVILIAYAFLMYFLAIRIPPADSWIASSPKQGVPNLQDSFSAIFGQSSLIIVGSIVAFLVSQVVDVWVFHRIKKRTGNKHLWLRATGSTLVSQLVDSYIVLFIAFSQYFTWQQILAIGLMNYIYKCSVAILLTPLIYVIEGRIEGYVGHATAQAMKRAAMGLAEEESPGVIPTAG